MTLTRAATDESMFNRATTSDLSSSRLTPLDTGEMDENSLITGSPTEFSFPLAAWRCLAATSSSRLLIAAVRLDGKLVGHGTAPEQQPQLLERPTSSACIPINQIDIDKEERRQRFDLSVS